MSQLTRIGYMNRISLTAVISYFIQFHIFKSSLTKYSLVFLFHFSGCLDNITSSDQYTFLSLTYVGYVAKLSKAVFISLSSINATLSLLVTSSFLIYYLVLLLIHLRIFILRTLILSKHPHIGTLILLTYCFVIV